MRRLRAAFRPLRRLVSWFALVPEEQSRRIQHVTTVEQQFGHRISELERWRDGVASRIWLLADALEDVRAHVTTLQDLLDKGVGARADATLSELWRRMENTDARHATALQRLVEDTDRVREENAAILALFAERGVRPPLPPDRRHPDRGSTREIHGSPSGTGTPAPFEVPTRDDLFRELERGTRSDVLLKLRAYTGLFRGQGPVVDLGSGRGEFLELAAEAGIAAYGVDTDPRAVELCRNRGLDAREENLIDHLEGLDPESLGGVMCAHVVEHLPPDMLPRLFELVCRALRPDGVVAVETPNPASFATHVHSFWRDPTHTRPVPPVSLAAAVRGAGLVVDDIIYLSPAAEEDHLKLVEPRSADELTDLVDSVNRALGQLNGLLYGPQDYALIGRKCA